MTKRILVICGSLAAAVALNAAELVTVQEVTRPDRYTLQGGEVVQLAGVVSDPDCGAFANEAMNAAKLPVGAALRIVRAGKADDGATLGYLYPADTSSPLWAVSFRLKGGSEITGSLNFYMVANGYARSSHVEHKFSSAYDAAEELAQINHWGMWATCMTPLEMKLYTERFGAFPKKAAAPLHVRLPKS